MYASSMHLIYHYYFQTIHVSMHRIKLLWGCYTHKTSSILLLSWLSSILAHNDMILLLCFLVRLELIPGMPLEIYWPKPHHPVTNTTFGRA